MKESSFFQKNLISIEEKIIIVFHENDLGNKTIRGRSDEELAATGCWLVVGEKQLHMENPLITIGITKTGRSKPYGSC